MGPRARMAFGIGLMAIGLAVMLFSAYELFVADSSWKWIAGIPDGAFAALTGWVAIGLPTPWSAAPSTAGQRLDLD
jgi:hypothetical protein